jgi:hypothetical protein
MKTWQKVGLGVLITGVGFVIGYETIPIFKFKIDELKTKFKTKKDGKEEIKKD